MNMLVDHKDDMLPDFLTRIKSSDANTRSAAWQSAGPMGAAAIVPLSDLMASDDRGVAKAANGALGKIAHYAARPGVRAEASAVSAELLKVAESSRPRSVRAHALHLLGFTGDGRVVPGLVKLLANTEIRDDARMTLERIPGSASLNALKVAAQSAPADFKPHLEQSLHHRALTSKTAGIKPGT